jgi:hypothetical protein
VTEPSRNGLRPVGAGRPIEPILVSVRPPFLECEDASTLSCYRCQHSESIELNTLEVIHKAERLDRERIEEIIRENDSSSPMR